MDNDMKRRVYNLSWPLSSPDREIWNTMSDFERSLYADMHGDHDYPLGNHPQNTTTVDPLFDEDLSDYPYGMTEGGSPARRSRPTFDEDHKNYSSVPVDSTTWEHDQWQPLDSGMVKWDRSGLGKLDRTQNPENHSAVVVDEDLPWVVVNEDLA